MTMGGRERVSKSGQRTEEAKKSLRRETVLLQHSVSSLEIAVRWLSHVSSAPI